MLSSLFHWIFSLTTGWKRWILVSIYPKSIQWAEKKPPCDWQQRVLTPDSIIDGLNSFFQPLLLHNAFRWIYCCSRILKLMTPLGLRDVPQWPLTSSDLWTPVWDQWESFTYTNRSMNTHNTKAMGEGWEISPYDWSLLSREFWV